MHLPSYRWTICALTLACCGPVTGDGTSSSGSESGTSGSTSDSTLTPTTTLTSITTVDPSNTVDPTVDPSNVTLTTLTTLTDPTTTTDPTTATVTSTSTSTSTTDGTSTTDTGDTDSDSSTGPVQMFDPLALEVQDFDGDGKHDLLVMGVDNFNGTAGRISLGVGDGTFMFGLDAGLSGASAFPVVGELDGTPGIDVMIAQKDGGAEVFRWGGAGFVSWKLFTNANVPRTHVVIDADKDDDDDIVWLWWTKNSVEFGLSIRPNGGGFFFAPVDTKVGVIADIGLAPGSLLVGRLNADSAADALVFEADKAKGFLRMFGSDPGLFGQPKFLLPTLRPWVASLADFDEDGDLDILMIEREPARLLFAFGDGIGGFTMGTSVPVAGPFKPFTFTTADLDGDKHLDVAVVDDQTAEFRVWKGDGKGGLLGPAVLPLPTPAVRVIAAPLDGDAKLDLVLATFAAGDVTVVLSP